jgi:CBS domain-containing protein
MAVAGTDILDRVAKLSDDAFAAFCEDIAGMFGVEMRCDRRQTLTMPARSLREHFKKLTAVHVSKAEGALNGTFQLVFDQGGLFILSGVIVMLPESRIIEDAKRGSMDAAENLQDAAREVGNLLVGSWDRVFREGCPGHQHFVKTSTFIGKPWEKPEQVELQANAEVEVVLYEMVIEPYPSFTCAAVFPSALLSSFGEVAPPAEPAKPEKVEPAAAEPPKPAPAPVPAPPAVPVPAVSQKPAEPVVSGSPVAGPASGASPAEKPVPAKADSSPAAAQASQPPSAKENGASAPAAVSAKPPVESAAPPSGAPSRGDGVIPPGRRNPPIDVGMLPSELASVESGGLPRPSGFPFLDAAYIQSGPQSGLAEFLNLPAAEVMEKDVVWAGPEETVQEVIAKMQQHNVGYVLIGVNGVLEGLVSSSNIQGAVSLYLRPVFAKWRRPQDDATLGVKVKWIMSRPVRTVRPDATLAGMIEGMRRGGGRCLPVVDAKGAVQGIVTVFDILLRILQSDKSVSWQGRPPQAPPLVI